MKLDLLRPAGSFSRSPEKAGDGGATRRARPALGTLVEVGLKAAPGARAPQTESAFARAFDSLAEVQRSLSRFEAGSDIARFNAAAAGAKLRIGAHALAVLGAAHALQTDSAGLFDVTLGRGPKGWALHDDELHKLDGAARIDLGGIGKGYAVDIAVETMIAAGCSVGWVNAGGDLRVFGDAALPLHLRDEGSGGTRAFATLRDGAFATSHLGRGCRSQAAGRHGASVHVSVAAPQCLWADALTKVVALSGLAVHPLLARHGARAWVHA